MKITKFLFVAFFTVSQLVAWPQTSDKLPGKGLSQFDFFYAGEGKFHNMYIVKNGKIAWEYKDADSKGEISDAVLLTNGNVLFAHQFGVTLITSKKEVLWNYNAPVGCEIHTAQPIGKDHVVFIQNGDTARLFVVNIKSGKIVKSFPLTVRNPKSIHGQFRHARLTTNGTILVAHMDMGKVIEYDINGKILFQLNVPGIWSVEPLRNGNFLVTNKGFVTEFTNKGDSVWNCPLKSIQNFKITSPQVAIRRPNGNTIVNNWFNQWSGNVDFTNLPVQAIELAKDKKVVWALSSWTAPADLGPSTIIQVLGDKGISENVRFGDIR